MNDDLRRLVGGVSCASLVDAMGRVHQHRAHILDLVSPDPTRVLFGPVVIVPGDYAYADASGAEAREQTMDTNDLPAPVRAWC